MGPFRPVYVYVMWYSVAQFVEALRYEPKSRGVNSRMNYKKFFIYFIFPAAPWLWGRLSL